MTDVEAYSTRRDIVGKYGYGEEDYDRTGENGMDRLGRDTDRDSYVGKWDEDTNSDYIHYSNSEGR